MPTTLSPFISEHLLVSGHRYLWEGGIEHNDISVGNLMYDKTKNGEGVLNDFDLAHVNGNTRPSGTARTGTMPFMALDLLTEGAWAGRVERLYRHDCESFAWVLLWICYRYDNGKEIEYPPLSEFLTSSFLECYRNKLAVDQITTNKLPTESYRKFGPAVSKLINHFLHRRLEVSNIIHITKYEEKDNDDALVKESENEDDAVAKELKGVLKTAGFGDVEL